MSKSICGAFKPNRNDELYTPKSLVEILDPYINVFIKDYVYRTESINRMIKPECQRSFTPTVWLPFDLESSEYVHYFKSRGDFNIEFSHISTGQDFFTYEPKNWDIAISNPPFSRKLDVFKRLNSLGKPWAMLGNLMSLNYQEIGNYFADNPVQMLIPDKRVSFDGNPSSFCSGYFCKRFLSSDLVFCHIENNNAKQYYIPSRMYSGENNDK